MWIKTQPGYLLNLQTGNTIVVEEVPKDTSKAVAWLNLPLCRYVDSVFEGTPEECYAHVDRLLAILNGNTLPITDELADDLWELTTEMLKRRENLESVIGKSIYKSCSDMLRGVLNKHGVKP